VPVELKDFVKGIKKTQKNHRFFEKRFGTEAAYIKKLPFCPFFYILIFIHHF